MLVSSVVLIHTTLGERMLVMSGEEKNGSQKITFGLVLKLQIPKEKCWRTPVRKKLANST